jgi:transposase
MNEETVGVEEQSAEPDPKTARQLIRRVKRYGRRRVSAEDKIRIVMEGLRGEQSVSDLCRQEDINKAAYYGWLKTFLEAGKKRLMGDHQREATSSDVKWLKHENDELKQMLAELALQNRRLKKSRMSGE